MSAGDPLLHVAPAAAAAAAADDGGGGDPAGTCDAAPAAWGVVVAVAAEYCLAQRPWKV